MLDENSNKDHKNAVNFSAFLFSFFFLLTLSITYNAVTAVFTLQFQEVCGGNPSQNGGARRCEDMTTSLDTLPLPIQAGK